MRIAIISDIHGNLEALQSILEHIKSQDINEIVCLGDVIGYGANPNECTDIIKETCKVVIAGNHDFAATGKTDISFFNPYAKQAVLWTKNVLTAASFEYISNLPFHEYVNERIYVHATPLRPENWGYIMSNFEALKEFGYFSQKVCFVGHSHFPIIIEFQDGKCQFVRNSEITLQDEKRYIINVGSVGQPRDGNVRACYIIYNIEAKHIQYHRVEYDIATTQKKIRDAGLPEILAERLAQGK